MKPALLTLWLCACVLTARAQRLHVVYAYEQSGLDYGLINLENDTLITEIMRTVSIGLNYPLKISYVPRNNFTRAGLRQTINALKSGPKDIIVLYYSGYGIVPTAGAGTSQTSFANWKLADVPRQGLPISEVEGWLNARNARLRLLIADCSAQLVPTSILAQSMGIGPDLRKRILQRLFLSTCGLVKMGSSMPSVPSWVDAESMGSVYTSALNNAFKQLLFMTDPAALPTVSFQLLSRLTAQSMAGKLYRLPFGQTPVLELKPCRPASPRVLQHPRVDPWANETLSGLLSAFALNPDSVQREALRRQLHARIGPNAVVEVSRSLEDSQGNSSQPLPAMAARYTFSTYLSQLRQPPGTGEGNQTRTINGRLIAVELTSKAATQPADSLTVSEVWREKTQHPPFRRK